MPSTATNRATRHLAPAKKASLGAGVVDSNLTVIIPAAGMGRRMKSYGTKSLLNLRGGSTVLERQLNLIWGEYPKADIIVVVGFEAEEIRKRVKVNYPIRLVYNPDFENTNVAFSVGLGLQAAVGKNALIVYGDLVFNAQTLRGVTFGESKLIYDTHGHMNSDEVGLVVQDEKVTNLAYGLDEKWAQICYLSNLEFDLFSQISIQEKARKWLGYEVINSVLESGGQFSAIEPRGMKITEIDTFKDLEDAKKLSN